MQLAEAMMAQRKLKKANEKLALARQKETTKAAKLMLKAAEDAAKAAARFIWTDPASLELLAFVKIVRDEHTERARLPGFTPFGKFFLAYTDRKDAYPLLEKLGNDTLLRRYSALMTLFRVSIFSLDSITCSGYNHTYHA